MKQDFVTFNSNELIINVAFEGKSDLVISKNDVEISYFSGGPGGQNVNRNMNGIRLVYRIPNDYRREAQRTRELVTRSIAERSQVQNLRRAFAQLAQKIQSYFYVPPVRKATKTPRRSKEKRLKNKKLHSLKKQTRKPIKDEL